MKWCIHVSVKREEDIIGVIFNSICVIVRYDENNKIGTLLDMRDMSTSKYNNSVQQNRYPRALVVSPVPCSRVSV